MKTQLTRDQILEVPCIVCDAKSGEQCVVYRDKATGVSQAMIGYHRPRVKLREKYPVLPVGIKASELSNPDKALIIYYAFVMLADSVAANSEAMFGKGTVRSSQDVQRFFASEAVVALRKDGLLK